MEKSRSHIPLLKINVQACLSRDHANRKQRVKTIDFQTIYCETNLTCIYTDANHSLSMIIEKSCCQQSIKYIKDTSLVCYNRIYLLFCYFFHIFIAKQSERSGAPLLHCA